MWFERSPLATKLLHIVLYQDDITQPDLKKSSPWRTCDLSLYKVTAIFVHYFWRYEQFSERHLNFSWSDFAVFSRNLWTTQIPCNNNDYSDYRVHGTKIDWLEPSVSTQKSVLNKYLSSPEILAKMFLGCSEDLLQATKLDHKKWKWCSEKCYIKYILK